MTLHLEAAHSLSIADLLRALNVKLGLEYAKLRETPSPPSPFASSPESEIDSLEARAQDVLRLVSSLRNGLRPVNRLPPEILSFIARCLIDCDAKDAIAIVPLTHVCRYWRESIISTPANWASISSWNEHMAVVSLERAKAAPLKISLNMRFDAELTSFPDAIVPYLQNIRTLAVVFLPSTEKFTTMFPNFPQSMPSLRSLELSLVFDEHWDRSVDIFESFTPPLTRLSLGNIPLYPSTLSLTTLTEVTIFDPRFNLHLDALLDFLEGNRSLESATLEIDFLEPSLLTSRRRIPMKNQLRRLWIESWDADDVQALISNIPIGRGSHLHVRLNGNARLSDIVPYIPRAYLLNLQSPTFFEVENERTQRRIMLRGQGGTFSFGRHFEPEEPFEDFSGLPLDNIREVRLSYSKTSKKGSVVPPVFSPTPFPLLETLTVEGGANVLTTLSDLLSNPSSSPSLKTLVFFNCVLSEEFMEGLTTFASERQISTTSTWLHRILIVRGDGVFPSAAAIRKLGGYVKVVDVRMGDKLPADLG